MFAHHQCPLNQQLTKNWDYMWNTITLEIAKFQNKQLSSSYRFSLFFVYSCELWHLFHIWQLDRLAPSLSHYVHLSLHAHIPACYQALTILVSIFVSVSGRRGRLWHRQPMQLHRAPRLFRNFFLWKSLTWWKGSIICVKRPQLASSPQSTYYL